MGRSDPPTLAWKVSLSWAAREVAGWQGPRLGTAVVGSGYHAKEDLVLRPVQHERHLILELYVTAPVGIPVILGEFRLDVCTGDMTERSGIVQRRAQVALEGFDALLQGAHRAPAVGTSKR